jgi:hypothetical protein
MGDLIAFPGLSAVLPYQLLSYKEVRQVLQYGKSTFKCRTMISSFPGRNALNRAAPSVCFAGRNNNTGCGNDFVFAVPAVPCSTAYFKVRQGTALFLVSSAASLVARDNIRGACIRESMRDGPSLSLIAAS